MVSPDLVRREDIGCQLDDIVTRRYFEVFTSQHLETVRIGSHVFLTPPEAGKAQTIVDNINNFGPLVRSTQAIREIGCSYLNICSLLASHGSEHLLTESLGKKPKISYKYDPEHKIPQAIIPYFRWSEDAGVFLSQDTVAQLADGWMVLRDKQLDQKDTYINIRLSEPLVRNYFYSAKDIVAKTSLPSEFVEAAMDVVYQRGLFKNLLWQGRLEPYYLAKQQYSNFLKKLRGLQSIGLHSPVQLSAELHLPSDFISATLKNFSKTGMFEEHMIVGNMCDYYVDNVGLTEISGKLSEIHTAAFVKLDKAADAMGINRGKLQKMSCNHGFRLPLTGELGDKLHLRYERSENGLPGLVLPYLEWSDLSPKLFSGQTIAECKEGIKTLRDLNMSEEKGLETRLAETLLMKDAYAPAEISERAGLEVGFVQAVMDIAYLAGMLQDALWRGTIHPYYMKKTKLGHLSRRVNEYKEHGLHTADQITAELHLPSDFVCQTLDNFYMSGMFKNSLLKGRLCPYYLAGEQFKELSKKIKEIHSADLLTLSNAAKETDMDFENLRKLVYVHGVQTPFTAKVDATLNPGYRASVRGYPEPVIPLYRWFAHSEYLIPRTVAVAIKKAEETLGSLHQDKDDAYNYYRLAEVFLMEDAYSAQQVSEKLALPLEIILPVMEESYNKGKFIDHLWKGLIHPYYITKDRFNSFSQIFKCIGANGLYTSDQTADLLGIPVNSLNNILGELHKSKECKGILWKGNTGYFIDVGQFRDLAKQIKKYQNSYSINDLAQRFDLERRLVAHVVSRLANQPGYEGIFRDSSKMLHVPRELIDGLPARERPLRQLILAEEKARDRLPLREYLDVERKKRAGHLIGYGEISKNFGISLLLASKRLRWLAANGYEQKIPVSYIGPLFISPDLIEKDVFAASVVSDKRRQDHYYTDLELQDKFPNLSYYRVKAILARFQDRFEGRIRDAYGNRIFVEKALIDSKSSLSAYMGRQNAVAQYASQYTRLSELQPFSNLHARTLRQRVNEISGRYRISLILASNVWLVELKRLRKDEQFREYLGVHTVPPPETPKNLRELVYGITSTSDMILHRMHRDLIPPYVTSYLEYAIHDIGSSSINRHLGRKLEEIGYETNTIDSLKALNTLLVSRRAPTPIEQLHLRILKVRLGSYYSKK